MPRHFLVDGHNALHRAVASPPDDADGQRRAVLLRVQGAVRTRRGGATGDLVHVVFDSDPGQPRAGTHGRDGDVSWSYARGSADEEIVRLVREHDGRRDGVPLVVVSDDRELCGRVGQLGAQTRAVGAFLDAVEKGPARGSPARDEPVDRPVGPPMKASDFGLPDAVDLDTFDPDL